MIPERSFNMILMFWSFELDDEQVRTKREEGKRLRWKQLQSMPIRTLLTRALNDNKDYTSNENSKFPRIFEGRRHLSVSMSQPEVYWFLQK